MSEPNDAAGIVRNKFETAQNYANDAWHSATSFLARLGGLARVNLSNLRQSSGRIRIESCPVYDGDLRDGRLIRDRTFQFHGDVTEQRTIQP